MITKNLQVTHSKKDDFSLSSRDIETYIKFFERKNLENYRFCCHKNINDKLHQMFIIHKKNYYIRPHKHLNKIETVFLIKGKIQFIRFTNKGNISEVINLSSNNSISTNFFVSVPKNSYHMMLIKSPIAVFLESTLGPFKKRDTFFPEWSPDRSEEEEIKKYIKKISINLKKYE
jgi:cupin fold WbuC family metalloprotein